MSIIEDRLRAYERFIRLPWQRGLSGSEKVWMVIYPPSEERRLRRRVQEFALATTGSGHGWKEIDLTPFFARWMADNPYREEYFEAPQTIDLALGDFATHLSDQVKTALESSDVDEHTVVAMIGAGSLFGLGSVRVSKLIEDAESSIRGRLVVFFPGERDGHNYRLLDARDGWSYLAVAIDEMEEET
jgi:hypothetical protein